MVTPSYLCGNFRNVVFIPGSYVLSLKKIKVVLLRNGRIDSGVAFSVCHRKPSPSRMVGEHIVN